MKKPMVTRTIKVHHVSVMCVSLDTAETFTETVTITGKLKSHEKIVMAWNAENGDNVKAVQVIGVKTEEKLYGMLETEFIEHAQEMKPRTKKNDKEDK